MLRFICAAVAAGVLAGTALAADPNNNGARGANPAGAGLVAPGQANWSYAKNDRILKYLGLTQEQCDKIDALWKDKNAAVQALYKGLKQSGKATDSSSGFDQNAMKEIQEKVKALEEAFKTKLLDVLTADQKAKYEAADKAWAAYQKTMTDSRPRQESISPEQQKAMREAQEKAMTTLKAELAKIFGDAFKADDFKRYGGISSSNAR